MGGYKRMNKMNFKKIIRLVEKYIIIMVVILQLLSQFIPPFNKLLDNYPNIVSAVVLILIFEIYQCVIPNENNKMNRCNLDDALSQIMNKKKKYKKVCIFAYSAHNYLKFFKRNSVQIEELYLLLRKFDENEAFLLHSKEMIEKYEKELTETIQLTQDLLEKKLIQKIHIRYFDFECYSHFAIFDSKIAIEGKLIHSYDSSKLSIPPVNIYEKEDYIIDELQHFFDAHYNHLDEYSGLKTIKEKDTCITCREILDFSDEHLHKFNAKGELCNFSILPFNMLEDFVLVPDMRPLSRVHLLLTTKFHVMCMFQYLHHNGAAEYLEELIKKIDDFIYGREQEHIVVFEHGSSVSNSALSGKSIDHLHLHILLKNSQNDLEAAIRNDKNKIVNTDDLQCKYCFDSLEAFGRFERAGNADYFLVWDPMMERNKITVYFPHEKESQYLRRIYFSTMSEEEKKSVGLLNDGDMNSCVDGYDWKKYGSNFTDLEKERYVELGAELKKYMER